MKRMSPGCNEVSKAAKSPARSRAGPEVIRIDTFISDARIIAKVVFPSPGGP